MNRTIREKDIQRLKYDVIRSGDGTPMVIRYRRLVRAADNFAFLAEIRKTANTWHIRVIAFKDGDECADRGTLFRGRDIREVLKRANRYMRMLDGAEKRGDDPNAVVSSAIAEDIRMSSAESRKGSDERGKNG